MGIITFRLERKTGTRSKTLGIAGFVRVPLVHGIALVWAIVGVKSHNKKLVASLS